MLQTMLNHGLRVIDLQENASSLMDAAYIKDVEAAAAILDTLLRQGANIRNLKPHQWLWYDTDEESMQNMVQLLLDRGADPDPRTSKWALGIMEEASICKYDRAIFFMLQACYDGGIGTNSTL